MKLVIQRVKHASCTIDGETVSKIDKGFMVLVGFGDGDNEETAIKLANKLIKLRVFDDGEGKMNLALKDVGGSILSISQFTLYADCKKGNRPSFVKAGAPDFAEEMYEYFKAKCVETFGKVECGSFGADMKVELENDGPFTILWDSDIW